MQVCLLKQQMGTNEKSELLPDMLTWYTFNQGWYSSSSANGGSQELLNCPHHCVCTQARFGSELPSVDAIAASAAGTGTPVMLHVIGMQ